MPGVAGVVAFRELLQKAKTTHIGITNIIFFILTIFFYRKNHNRAKKKLLQVFALKSLLFLFLISKDKSASYSIDNS